MRSGREGSRTFIETWPHFKGNVNLNNSSHHHEHLHKQTSGKQKYNQLSIAPLFKTRSSKQQASLSNINRSRREGRGQKQNRCGACRPPLAYSTCRPRRPTRDLVSSITEAAPLGCWEGLVSRVPGTVIRLKAVLVRSDGALPFPT